MQSLAPLSALAATALFFHSQPGDYIGQGKTQLLVEADGYVVSAARRDGHVQVEFLRTAPSGLPINSWSLYFQPPSGQPLAPGVFQYGVDLPPTAAQFRLWGDGRGCGVSGQVEVLAVAFDANGDVTSLAMDFDQRCGRVDEALFGQLRYRSEAPLDLALRYPDPFSFPGVANAMPGSAVVSAPATIAGIDVAVPISISGGDYSINGGAYASIAGSVVNGDRVQVRVVTPPAHNALTIATLTVGTEAADFEVGTSVGENPQPNGGSLAVLNSQPRDPLGAGKYYVRSAATLTAISTSEREDHRGAFTIAALAAEFDPGWTFYFAAPNRSPLVRGTFPFAWVGPTRSSTEPMFEAKRGWGCDYASGSFTVLDVVHDATGITSLALDFTQFCNGSADPLYGYLRFNSNVPIAQIADTTPLPFQVYVPGTIPLNAVVTSNTVTIEAINVAVPVGIVGGEYSIDGGPFTTLPGTISAGQKLTLRVKTANAASTLTTATITVGSYSAVLNVTTGIPNTQPQPFSFERIYKALPSVWVESQVVVPVGFDGPSPVRVRGGEVSIAGGPFTTADGTLQPGESLQARVRSSPQPSSFAVALVVVGRDEYYGRAAQFQVVTSDVPRVPAFSDVRVGDGTARFWFDEIPTGNTLPATGFTVSCTPGSHVATSSASPITVAGLTNGAKYSCAVSGTNEAGSGPQSSPVQITPSASIAPQLFAVYSRKAHGAAQNYDLALGSDPANPTTEPRSAVSGEHTIVFVFGSAVIGGSAAATGGNAVAGVAQFSGNEMIVPVSGIEDAQFATIAVRDVSSAYGAGGGSGSVRVGFLLGDVDGNRMVTMSDLLLVNAVQGESVSAATFRRDVNLSGSLTPADKLLVDSNLTRSLPAP